MKKKLLCLISVIFVALSLCVFANCNGCNGCGGKTGELKSSMGVTVTGGNFGKKAKLITEKVEMTEETVKSTIDKLPEEYKLLLRINLKIPKPNLPKPRPKMRANTR